MNKVHILLLFLTAFNACAMEEQIEKQAEQPQPTNYTNGSNSALGAWGCYHSKTLGCCTHSYEKNTYHDVCADDCDYAKNRSSSSSIKRTNQEKHELYTALQNEKAQELAQRAQRLMRPERAIAYAQHILDTVAAKTK